MTIMPTDPIQEARRSSDRPVVSRLTRLALCVSLAAAAWTPALAGQEEAAPIDHQRALAFFQEARGLDAGNPWNGPLYGPLLFVEPRTRYVVANEPDEEGRLAPRDGVFVGSLPEGVGVANTSTAWAGKRWTMVRWPLPQGRYARRRLVGHELFHRLGPEIGVPMASPANAHLDTSAGRLWFRLEVRALVRALASAGAGRTQAVADALAFRRRRHDVFPQGALEERALELNEGLAEYTGMRVALPEGARLGWAIQRMEAGEVEASRTGITRNFAYTSGPGYGLLLDAAMPGWHAQVSASSDLGELLARAYGVEVTDELAAGATDRVVEYDGIVLRAFEMDREAVRVRQQAAFRARYVDGPVLWLPVDEDFGYTFNPNEVVPLEGVGQVLETARMRAGWGTLDVTNGVLLRRGEAGITGIVVPVLDGAAGPPVSGGGWSLRLSDGWEVVPGERGGDWVAKPRRSTVSCP